VSEVSPIGAQSVNAALRAQADADRAATAAGVGIRVLSDLAGQGLARRLFDQTWSSDGETQVTSNLMQALVHSGAYVSGAFIGDRIVGAAFAFPGRDLSGHWHLHSHMAAVLEEARDRRIGGALKWHQRAWAIEHGYETITWTFDPLVRRNARLNLLKLGVFVSEYYEDFYGDMADSLNAGDATDRAMARWELLSARTLKAAASPNGLDPDPIPTGAALAVVVEHDEPIVREVLPTADVLLVALPTDIIEIREKDPALAARWRMAVRSVLSPALAGGMEITGFTSDGSYIVERVWL
jgi:predicted GNAT superfamily acetyltransferase